MELREDNRPYWYADLECPHCKAEYMMSGCHETDSGEQECEVCGEVFFVEIEYDPRYVVSKEE